MRDLRFITVSAPERGNLLVLRVPASPEVPHLLSKDERLFQAPRRYGAQTAWMGEWDLEQAYRHRFAGQRDRQQALDSLVEAQVRVARLRLASDWRGRVVFVGAAVPVEARRGVVMTSEEAAEILHEAKQLYRAIGNLPLEPHVRDLPPRPGLRRFAAGPDRDRTISVHLDGSASLTDALEAPRVGAYGGTVVPGLELEKDVARLVATMGATGRALGVVGEYMVKVAVVWNQPEALRFVWPDPNVVDLHHLVEPVLMVHEIEPTGIEISADAALPELGAAVRRLALDLLHQGGLTRTRFVA